MKIKFLPTGQEIDLNPQKTLLQLAWANGIEIRSICKGQPSCAECRIKIIEGEHNTLPPTKAELALIGTSYYLDSRRLACQVRCFGPMTIDIKDHLDKADSSSKKIRGFKSNQQVASQAIQDTLLLSEVQKDLTKPVAKSPTKPSDKK